MNTSPKNWIKYLIFFCFAFSFLIFFTGESNAQNLIHNFEFNGNLNDSRSTGISLTEFNTASSSFQSNPNGWTWTQSSNPGGGLELSTSILPDPQAYSLGFRIEFDNTGNPNGTSKSYRKIISFNDSDNGLYFNHQNLQFFPFGASNAITYLPNTFYDFVLTRTSNDKIIVYIVEGDGTVTKVYEEDDPNDQSVPIEVNGNRRFRFFMDENQGPEHTNGGTVRGIRMWDAPLGPDEIGAALSSVTTGDPSIVADNLAIVEGSINPQGSNTNFTVEYGTTQSLGSSVNMIPASSAGSAEINTSATLPNLSPSTLYYYRVKGSNASGESLGSIKSFTTLSDDIDGDGVVNSLDQDDDNDGILDVDEGLGVITPQNPQSTVSYTVSQVAANGPTISSPSTGYAITNNNSPGVFSFSAVAPGESGTGSGTGTISRVNIQANYAPGEIASNVDVSLTTGAFDDGLYIEVDGVEIVNFNESDYNGNQAFSDKFNSGSNWTPWNNTGNPALELDLINQEVRLMVDVTDGTSPSRQDALALLPNAKPNAVPVVNFSQGVTIGTAFQNNNGAGSIGSQTLTFRADIKSNNPPPVGNIWSFHSLDSDGDGCNDVIEAGFSDPDGDGQLGPAALTVDPNTGRVTSGTDGYTTPRDGDGNGVKDFKEVTSDIAISNQPPSTQNIFETQDATIAVQASGTGNQYQWQVSTDNGVTFTDLSDDSDYNNVNTNTLTLLSVEASQNNYQYRVLVTNGTRLCQVLTSNATTITVDSSGPGGVVGANLWLKADDGVRSASNGTLTAWLDQTNKLNTTVVGNPQIKANVVNFLPSVAFDGIEDHIEVSNTSLLNTNSFTINVVVKATGGSGYRGIVSSKAPVFQGFTIYLNPQNELELWIPKNSGQWSIIKGGELILNTWNQITVTFNGTIAKLYVDGKEVGSGAGTSRINNLAPFFIGAANGGSNNGIAPDPFSYFIGEIPEVIFFPSVLSENDRKRVESYLALDYGITLDKSNGAYIASDGNTQLWTNKEYWNDVFGIGKDEQGDIEKQSAISVNTHNGNGDLLPGQSHFVLFNSTSLTDGDFLMIGHNEGLLELKRSSALNGWGELKRKWKVEKTGDLGNISLKFDLDALPVIGQTIDDYLLLIDTDGDGDFSSGLRQVKPTILTNQVLFWNSVNIPDGAVITLADKLPNAANSLNANRIIVNPSFESGSIVPHSGAPQYPESQVGDMPQIDGWYSTHPTFNGAEGAIEHWSSGFNGVPAQNGNYFVELNVSQSSRLYQHVFLVNGERVDWRYYHRQRVASATEELRFSVYSDDGSAIVQNLDTHRATSTSSWQERTGNFTWNQPTGFYQIGFESTTAGGSGNFLDNITIGLQAFTEFARDTVRLTEGQSIAPYIYVNGQIDQASSFTVQVDGGGAIEGTDYRFTNKTINVPVGNYALADSLALAFEIIDNNVPQNERIIELGIAGTTGDVDRRDANADGIYQRNMIVIIEDNDPCKSAGTNVTYSTCASTASSLDLLSLLGGSPDPGGNWQEVLTNSGVDLSDPSSVDFSSVGVGVYSFVYTQPVNGICPETFSTLTIAIREPFPAGEDNTVEVCNDGTTVDLFASIAGAPQAGGRWTKVTSSTVDISDPTAVSFNNLSAGSYEFLYTLPGNLECNDQGAAAKVTVNVIATPNSGTPTSVNVCDGGASTSLDFSVLLVGADKGGAWMETSGVSSGVDLTDDTNVDFDGVAAGKYTFDYTVAGTSPCGSATSTLTVNVNQDHDAGTNAATTVCNDSGNVDLFASLGGTPDAGGTWKDSQDAVVSNPTQVDFTGVAPGTYDYTYTITGEGVCNDVSATVSVTVTQGANAGSNSTVNVCDGGASTTLNLFTSLSNNPDAGGNWTETSVLPSGANISDPTAVNFSGVPAGKYQFTYTVNGNGPCGNVSSTVTVNVNQVHNAGTPTTISICNDSPPLNLFANLSGNPDAGGTWVLNGNNPIIDPTRVDFTGLSAGNYVYTYTISGDPGSACGDVSNTLTVQLVEAPNAGRDKRVDLCKDNNASLNLFTALGGAPDAGGEWTDLDNSGISISANTADFTNVSDGVYRYEYVVTDPAICTTASSTLTVNVTSIVNVGPDVSLDVCQDGTTIDITDYGMGTRPTARIILAPGVQGIDLSDPTQVNFDNVTFSGESRNIRIIYIGPTNTVCSATGGQALDQAYIEVTLYKEADAGQASTVNVCDGGASTTLDLFGSLGGTPQAGGTWEEFVQNSGDAFSGVSLTNPGNVDFDGVAAGKYFFRYTVAGRGNCADDTAVLTVNVNQDHDAGADATLAVCNDALSTYDLFASLGGTPDPGGIWVDDDNTGLDLSDPSSVNFNSLAAGDYDFTYSIAGEGVCNTVSSTLTVTVTPAPDAGQDNTVSVCDGGPSTTVNLFTSLLGTPDAGGTWSEITSSGADITDPAAVDFDAIPSGRYEFRYTVSGTGPCSLDSATIIVNVNQVATVGSADNIFACSGDVKVSLFSGLVGSVDPGGTWSDDDATGVDLSDPDNVDISSLKPGSYAFTYTLSGVGACDDVSITTNLTVNPAISAGDNTVIEVCNGTSSSIVDILGQIPGNPSPGGEFIQLEGLGVDFTNPNQVDFTGVAAGAYPVYYLVSAPGFCATETNLITIDVKEAPTVSIPNNLEVCNDEFGEIDFTALNSGAQGGVWTDDDNTGVDLTDLSAVSFENITPGIYSFSYTIASNGICGAVSGTSLVEVFQGLDAGIDSSAEICADGTALNLFAALRGTPDTGGIWNNKDGASVDLTDPTAVDFSNVPSGTYRFGYSVLASGIGPCTSKSSVLTVTVNALPNAGNDVRVPVCVDPNGTTVNLFDYISTTAQTTGTWANGSSTSLDLNDPTNVDISTLVDGSYNFVYTVAGNGSCADDTATIILDINELPNAGTSTALSVCNDGSAVDLFGALGNDAELGGQWIDLDGAKVDLNNSASVNFNKVKGGQYRFEYTVQGLGACADASSIVTVEVQERPNAGFSASVSVCDGGASTVVDLFSSLQGNPATGGSWAETSTNASGADLTDPSAVDFNGIPAGRYVFTYTVASNGSCSDAVSEVIVNVNQDHNAGIDTTADVCQDAPVDLTTLLNGSPDPGGKWLDVKNTDIDLSDPRAVDLSSFAVGTYSIKYVLVGNGSCNDVSSVLTLDVKPATDAGISASAQACTAQGSTFNLFAALAGTPDAGGSWTDDDASGVDITNPSSVDLSNLTAGVYHFTYTITGDCTTKSARVALTVANARSAGSDTAVAVCNDGTSLNLFTSLGGSPDIGGVWTDLDNASVSLVDPTNVDFNTVASGVYRFAYELAGNGACTSSRAIVTVTVNDAVSAGRSTAVTTCNQLGADNIDLFALLGAGADNGGIWADLNASGVDITDPTNVDFDGVPEGNYSYEYTVTGSGTCPDSKAQITVHVVSAQTAGTGGTVNLTNDGVTVDLTAQISNGNPGGNWTDTNGVGVNLSDPTAVSFANILAGTYAFEYEIPANGACASSSTTVTVNVINAANAGENTRISLCTDDATRLNLYSLMNGNPSNSGTWNPVGIKLDNFDPTQVDLSEQKTGSYIFNYIVQNPGSTDKASLTIELSENGNAGIGNSATNEIITCNSGADPIDLFSILGGNPDLDGIWSEPIGPTTIDVSDPRNVTFNGAAAGFYEFQYTVLSDGGCNPTYARVYIEVDEGANPGNNGTVEVCNQSGALIDLFAQLGGSPDAGGTWTDPNGSPVSDPSAVNFQGLPAGNYLFTYTIQPTGSCTNPVSSTVTVEVNRQLSAGENGSILRDFNSNRKVNLPGELEGSPDPGGTWYDDSNSGVDLSDPNDVDLSELEDGIYSFRYRIEPAGSCLPVEATVTVIVNFVADSEEDTQVIEGFSPDGDGINDFWLIENIDQFPSNEVKIFNRWGHLVFEQKFYNNMGRVFTGVANRGNVIGASELPTGTYFYIIDFGDGTPVRRGFITLVR